MSLMWSYSPNYCTLTRDWIKMQILDLDPQNSGEFRYEGLVQDYLQLYLYNAKSLTSQVHKFGKYRTRKYLQGIQFDSLFFRTTYFLFLKSFLLKADWIYSWKVLETEEKLLHLPVWVRCTECCKGWSFKRKLKADSHSSKHNLLPYFLLTFPHSLKHCGRNWQWI